MPLQETDAITALNAEWQQLGTDSGALRTVTGWLAEVGVSTTAETLTGVLDELGRRDRQFGRGHSDVWLRALLERAVGEGEQSQLAARVLAQAMLPYATQTVQRLLGPAQQPFEDVAQVVVGCLYQTIRCYPLRRRSQRIAANVAMDTRKSAVRELRRESVVADSTSVQSVEAQLDSRQVGSNVPEERAQLAVLAEAAGLAGLHGVDRPVEELAGSRGEVVELLLWALDADVLTSRDAWLINDYYRSDAPAQPVAAGAKPATLRQWRSRAVRRLQGAAPGRWVKAA